MGNANLFIDLAITFLVIVPFYWFGNWSEKEYYTTKKESYSGDTSIVVCQGTFCQYAEMPRARSKYLTDSEGSMGYFIFNFIFVFWFIFKAVYC